MSEKTLADRIDAQCPFCFGDPGCDGPLHSFAADVRQQQARLAALEEVLREAPAIPVGAVVHDDEVVGWFRDKFYPWLAKRAEALKGQTE